MSGGKRKELVCGGGSTVRDLFAMGIMLDAVAQLLIYRLVHPGAALVIGPVLITLPYAASGSVAPASSAASVAVPSIESANIIMTAARLSTLNTGVFILGSFLSSCSSVQRSPARTTCLPTTSPPVTCRA